MSKCEHCPVKAGDCIASSPGHAFACKMAVRGSESELRWIADASGQPPPPVAYPSLVKQAGTLLKAGAALVASGLAIVDQAEFDRRHAICEACPHFDSEANRCRKCACYLAVKPWLKAEHCPNDPPRW